MRYNSIILWCVADILIGIHLNYYWRCDETMALRLPYARWNHKMQNQHTHALYVCIHHVHFSFFISFPARCRWRFLHHSLHRVCIGYVPKMIWVNRRRAQYRVCLFMHLQRCYRSIFFNPLFSLACAHSFRWLPFTEQRYSVEFSTIFSNSMFDLLFTLLMLFNFSCCFLLFFDPSSHAARVCVS